MHRGRSSPFRPAETLIARSTVPLFILTEGALSFQGGARRHSPCTAAAREPWASVRIIFSHQSSGPVHNRVWKCRATAGVGLIAMLHPPMNECCTFRVCVLLCFTLLLRTVNHGTLVSTAPRTAELFCQRLARRIFPAANLRNGSSASDPIWKKQISGCTQTGSCQSNSGKSAPLAGAKPARF